MFPGLISPWINGLFWNECRNFSPLRYKTDKKIAQSSAICTKIRILIYLAVPPAILIRCCQVKGGTFADLLKSLCSNDPPCISWYTKHGSAPVYQHAKPLIKIPFETIPLKHKPFMLNPYNGKILSWRQEFKCLSSFKLCWIWILLISVVAVPRFSIRFMATAVETHVPLNTVPKPPFPNTFLSLQLLVASRNTS